MSAVDKRVEIEIHKPKIETIEAHPIKNELLWYNTFFGRMEKYEGSYVSIKYEEVKYIEKENGIRIPISEASEAEKEKYEEKKEFVQVAQAVIENNKITKITYESEKIKAACKIFENIEIEDDRERIITITIDEKDVDMFTRLLENNDVKYEVQ